MTMTAMRPPPPPTTPQSNSNNEEFITYAMKMTTMKSRTPLSHSNHGLFLLLTLIQGTHGEGGDNDWEQWVGLARYIIAFLFTVLGLQFLLYSHISTYTLVKTYRDHGLLISGDVLSCDESTKASNKWEVAVLYVASAHKYEEDPRNRFRYPNAVCDKRFLRRFETDHPIPRGTKVEVLLRKGVARSGLLKETVERNLQSHSHLRTVLLLVPGLLLLGFILWLAVEEVKGFDDEDSTLAWIILGIALFVIVLVSTIWADGRFAKEKRRRFESAVPMATKPSQQPNKGKSQPLLHLNDGLPIVQGRDVF
jgi:hypothetical protein